MKNGDANIRRPLCTITSTTVSAVIALTARHFSRFQDILADKIECIVVKDLSWLGRDHITVGYHLDIFFPRQRVRFVSINDHFDPIDGITNQNKEGPIQSRVRIPFINLFNEQIFIETKIKVTESLDMKAQRGEFNGQRTPFGYQKSRKNPDQLIPNPVATIIVQKIFEMAASGIGATGIVRYLNERSLSTPIQYARSNGLCGNYKDEALEDVFVQIESTGKPEDALLISPIPLKVQVDYDIDQDDIRCFADYIMEFSPENTSFYFIYQYGINNQTFKKAVDAAFEKLSARFQKLTGDADKDQRMIHMIREMLIDLYPTACEETAWFADHAYMNKVEMEVSDFKELFHYQHIVAGRSLADEGSDKTGLLSRDMIAIAEQEEQWNDLLRKLPDEIIRPIQDLHIQENVREASVESLNEAMDEISKTIGGQEENIAIDMDVSEDAIRIHIHLQLVKYKKTIDPLVVNFL